MIGAFGEYVWTRCDEVNFHLIGGTGFWVTHQLDVGLVDLPQPPQRENLFLHPQFQGLRGGDAMVLNVESHVFVRLRLLAYSRDRLPPNRSGTRCQSKYASDVIKAAT